MKAYSWLTGMMCAGALTVCAAEPQDSGTQPTPKPVVTVVDSIDLLMNSWYEEMLAGNDSQANAIEHNLVRVLGADIMRTQERLAKTLEKSRTGQEGSNLTLAKADSNGYSLHESTEFLTSNLNVKRLLLESITKTDAFSNKYRLLGDYVDLLRREVGLPKLKLASDKHVEAQKN